MASQDFDHPPTPEEGEPFSDQLELLAVMGRNFAQSLDIDETLHRALEHITMYMDAASGALFLLEDEGATLRCHVSMGETQIEGITLSSNEGIVGRCMQKNKGEVIHDASKDPDFYKEVDKFTGVTTTSILCAPLSVKDQRIGAVELINRKSGDGLFVDSDLNMLEALCSSAALAILNARMAESMVEQERVRRELELAAEIQRTLLPTPVSEPFPIHGINIPARMVSGDFFDFFTLDDGRICFNLGDVSGKGMNAALLMAKTASLYRCLGKTIHQPGHLMSLVNAEICETATRGMFVTMIGGIYDPGTGLVVLANAGHEPPLYHCPDGTFATLPAGAPPLGIPPSLVKDNIFPENELRLDGGTLYIFTDGLTEGAQENGKPLEVEGLKALLKEAVSDAVTERIQAVIGSVHRPEETLRDDLTILAVDDSLQKPARDQRMTTEPLQTAHAVDGTLLNMTFPARADRLKLVRRTVSETAEFCGCQPDTAQGIVIAVDEACQNVIRHAYGTKEAGQIDLELRREGNNMVVLVRDFADPIDPDSIKPRELDDLRAGGLGTHFMREVMDDVAYTTPSTGDGNLLRMVKRIN